MGFRNLITPCVVALVCGAPAYAQADPLPVGTWVGSETLANYGRLEFRAENGGRVTMVDVRGSHAGRWTRSGNSVLLRFFNGRVTYRGTINGVTLTGAANNRDGKSWTWTTSLKGLTYRQRTGEFFFDGRFIKRGYSGRGAGRNNPAWEAQEDRGPIPQGKYSIAAPRRSEVTGPSVMDLSPIGHNARGRSAFQIHGEKENVPPGNASRGCIIISPESVRRQIWALNARVLRVVE